MRIAWAFVIAAGCSSAPGSSVDAVIPHPPLSLDVTVSPTEVDVYTGGTDACAGATYTFPPPGMTTYYSDGLTCSARASCLDDVHVESAGVTISSAIEYDDYHGVLAAPYASSPDAALTLVIHGCELGTARVELSNTWPTPWPTMAATFDPTIGTTISWTTEVPSPTALVYEAYELSADASHVSGVQQVVMPAFDAGPLHSLYVQAFTAEQTAETDLGELRIWSGGIANVTLPPMQ